MSIVPLFTIIISILISIGPFQSNFFSVLAPAIVYFPLYFWTLFRPIAFSYLNLFILGLLKDIVENGIFGLNALCFLIFYFMVKSSRKHILNHGIFLIWTGFVFSFSFILLIILIITKLSSNIDYIPIILTMQQLFIEILLYPIAHYLLSKLHKIGKKKQ